jgi:hypothetical protein
MSPRQRPARAWAGGESDRPASRVFSAARSGRRDAIAAGRHGITSAEGAALHVCAVVAANGTVAPAGVWGRVTWVARSRIQMKVRQTWVQDAEGLTCPSRRPDVLRPSTLRWESA